jgi:23S rRNA (uracil1939-C5)-methyltransferase
MASTVWPNIASPICFEATTETLAALGRFDKMLIDPPREGALELIKALDSDAPRRIVYISCSPATLARDAAILVAQKNYQLRGAGVINMFSPYLARRVDRSF